MDGPKDINQGKWCKTTSWWGPWAWAVHNKAKISKNLHSTSDNSMFQIRFNFQYEKILKGTSNIINQLLPQECNCGTKI